MAKHRIIKYLRHPAFTEMEWQTRNPLLSRGEIGFVLENGIAKRHKVGPGLWNDLPYESDSIYDYEGDVLTPIGDAFGDLSGKTTTEILYLMLNGYTNPVISSVSNNGGIGFANEQIKEVGQTLNGPISVNYAVSNSENLSGATPINITTPGGTFSNEGNFTYTGQVLLSLGASLTPTSVTEIVISLIATHARGTTEAVNTTIKFLPRIMWATSSLLTMPDGATFMSIGNRQSLVVSDYKRDFAFTTGNYAWVAIPEMLGPTNLKYADVTNSLTPLPFAMTDMGNLSINNGVGTYTYRMLRSTYKMINPSTLRIG